MGWSFLVEPVEESSAGCWAVSHVSELVKLRNTQGRFFWLDKEMGSCQSSQSGTTSKPSDQTTQNVQSSLIRCEQYAKSLSYRVDFLAKTYQSQVQAQGLTESEAGYGKNLPVSLAKYDQQESLWKTHQHSLFGGLELFLETWPRWGMMRNGECWELLMQGHLTRERESGLWPTPNARDWKDRNGLQGKRKSPNLGVVVHWPTPRSCSAMAASITPESAWSNKRFRNLETVVGRATYPTPGTTGMSNGSGNCEKSNKLHADGFITEKERVSMRSGNGGLLNPNWVEWLMGWPLMWTSKETITFDWRGLETDPANNGEISRIAEESDDRKLRLRAIGNGQVPAVAHLAWTTLNQGVL